MIPTSYVVDVGQGSCNVIITGKAPTGGNRAIIIDCGPRTPDVPMELLVNKDVAMVDALIVSHRDKDHCGGLEKVLGGYRNRIVRTFFTGGSDPKVNPAFRILNGFYDHGFMETNPLIPKGFAPTPIAFEDPYCVYPDHSVPTQKSPSLFIIAPSRDEAEDKSLVGKPNQTSAIVVFKNGSSRTVFPGDATIPAWDSLFGRMGKRLRVDVMVVPHHGGLVHNPKKKDLERLYGEITQCEYAVVSAGTNNNQGKKINPKSDHPREDVLEAIYNVGSKVVCTEMTANCSCLIHDELLKLRNRRTPLLPSFSKIDPNKVPCVGTICMVMHPDKVEFVECMDIHDDNWKSQQATCCPTTP